MLTSAIPLKEIFFLLSLHLNTELRPSTQASELVGSQIKGQCDQSLELLLIANILAVLEPSWLLS